MSVSTGCRGSGKHSITVGRQISKRERRSCTREGSTCEAAVEAKRRYKVKNLMVDLALEDEEVVHCKATLESRVSSGSGRKRMEESG